eukprot:s1137_g4.t1
MSVVGRITAFFQKTASEGPGSSLRHDRQHTSMLQKSNPGTVWKQRTATSPEDTAPSDPALFSFEFGQDGFLETQELMTQFGAREENTKSCLGYAPTRGDRTDAGFDLSNVQPADWQQQFPNEYIELTPYAMPCNTDYYQDNARAWQGYAVFNRKTTLEKCMTFNQQFNIGTFQLPAGIFQGWKFELPVPNIALEVQLCFPWFGISLGRISQIEIALILVDVEVLRLTWRWNNFGTGDFRLQTDVARGPKASNSSEASKAPELEDRPRRGNLQDLFSASFELVDVDIMDIPSLVETIMAAALDDDDVVGDDALRTIQSVFRSDENPLDPMVLVPETLQSTASTVAAPYGDDQGCEPQFIFDFGDFPAAGYWAQTFKVGGQASDSGADLRYFRGVLGELLLQLGPLGVVVQPLCEKFGSPVTSMLWLKADEQSGSQVAVWQDGYQNELTATNLQPAVVTNSNSPYTNGSSLPLFRNSAFMIWMLMKPNATFVQDQQNKAFSEREREVIFSLGSVPQRRFIDPSNYGIAITVEDTIVIVAMGKTIFSLDPTHFSPNELTLYRIYFIPNAVGGDELWIGIETKAFQRTGVERAWRGFADDAAGLAIGRAALH